jgi:outer membrane protein OmpA-like peptidoglycan-associated protein/tetratricopeptide (TPR) repeat protein
MKIKLSILFVFLVSLLSAQMRYSSKNKGAIKLFKKAMEAPGKSYNPTTGMPDYQIGLDLLDKALKKDERFWEAHLLAGEFCEYLKDYYGALGHYEAAIKINPNHSATDATYYYAGILLFQMGKYEQSEEYLTRLVKNRAANPEYVREGKRLIQCSQFAINSIQNPREFNPINIGPGINTKDPEYFPTITVDGKTILFTRRIVEPRSRPHGVQEDFYISDYDETNKKWGQAIALPKNINTLFNEGAPTIGPDGRSLIFVACSDMSGVNYGEGREGKGSCDLFYTKKVGSRWLNPVNIPGYINTSLWETQPSLSADGKTLYFIREIKNKGASDNADIYMSKLQENGTWGQPIRLPDVINTPYAEESVLIHPDGKTLYFASKGHIGMGGTDLFVSRMDDNGNWSEPQNLGYPINTSYNENSLMVSPEGDIAFFASNRKGGYGELDIYYFELPADLRPTKTLYFEGVVYDVNTKKPLGGKFELIDIQSGNIVVTEYADVETGEFTVSLPVNREYALKVTHDGYAYFSANFNMTVPEDQEVKHMDVPLTPIVNSGSEIVLANIFFDRNKSDLKKESFVELANLIEYLNKNPTVKIEIGGHTDTRDDDAKNLELSTRRAKVVYDYLIQKGIQPNRLSYKGYGETQLLITDEQIANLSTDKEKEAAHQKNRRTVYKILP